MDLTPFILQRKIEGVIIFVHNITTVYFEVTEFKILTIYLYIKKKLHEI